MIPIADVNKLKCILFYNMRLYIESLWYGIECNIEDYLNCYKKAYQYLALIKTGCELPYDLVCEILAFIKQKSNICNQIFDACSERLIVSGGV